MNVYRQKLLSSVYSEVVFIFILNFFQVIYT